MKHCSLWMTASLFLFCVACSAEDPGTTEPLSPDVSESGDVVDVPSPPTPSDVVSPTDDVPPAGEDSQTPEPPLSDVPAPDEDSQTPEPPLSDVPAPDEDSSAPPPPTECGDSVCTPGVEDCLKCPGDCPCNSGTSCNNQGHCVEVAQPGAVLVHGPGGPCPAGLFRAGQWRPYAPATSSGANVAQDWEEAPVDMMSASVQLNNPWVTLCSANPDKVYLAVKEDDCSAETGNLGCGGGEERGTFQLGGAGKNKCERVRAVVPKQDGNQRDLSAGKVVLCVHDDVADTRLESGAGACLNPVVGSDDSQGWWQLWGSNEHMKLCSSQAIAAAPKNCADCLEQCGECPGGAPPTVPDSLRFETMTITHCKVSQEPACAEFYDECPVDADDGKCLCPSDLDTMLNNQKAVRYIAMPKDKYKGDLWAKGNTSAMYIDTVLKPGNDGLNGALELPLVEVINGKEIIILENQELLKTGGDPAKEAIAIQYGKDKAAEHMQTAWKGHSCGVPEWFVLNEMSMAWKANAYYRLSLITLVERLADFYGRKLLLPSQIELPKANYGGVDVSADWQSLIAHVTLGIERYVSGKEAESAMNSVVAEKYAKAQNWAKNHYQESIDAYTTLGIPTSQLVLLEHFGNTIKQKEYGRAGVDFEIWKNTVKTRAKGAKALGLSGYMGYAWSGNEFQETGANRKIIMKLHLEQELP